MVASVRQVPKGLRVLRFLEAAGAPAARDHGVMHPTEEGGARFSRYAHGKRNRETDKTQV